MNNWFFRWWYSTSLFTMIQCIAMVYIIKLIIVFQHEPLQCHNVVSAILPNGNRLFLCFKHFDPSAVCPSVVTLVADTTCPMALFYKYYNIYFDLHLDGFRFQYCSTYILSRKADGFVFCSSVEYLKWLQCCACSNLRRDYRSKEKASFYI